MNKKMSIFGWTALIYGLACAQTSAVHEAARKGDIEALRALLARNPEQLDARGEYDRTPLLEALFARQGAAARFLLDQGADVRLKDKEGVEPLGFAAFIGDPDLVNRIIDRGGDVNNQDNPLGWSPLHIAARFCHPEAARVLFEKGARADPRDTEGNTPLMAAVVGNCEGCFKLLAEKGADVNNKNVSGDTPLHAAALSGAGIIVDFLVARGADPSCRNGYGNTPVQIAVREGHTDVVELFKAKGIKPPAIEFPKLAGRYLGQKPPGPAPEVFAPGVVSTERDELNSVFTPDGREFYFAVSTGRMNWKFMVMKQGKDGWERPQDASFSGRWSDVDLFISPDGRKLYFSSNRPLNGQGEAKKDFDIWAAERWGDGWSEPVNLGPPVNSDTDEFYPAVDEKGTLYFQSQRDDSRGARDIYFAGLEGGRYREVKNGGDGVNGPGFESDAYIAPDGRFLIFSSNRAGGRGQGDLYISFRQDGSWTPARDMGSAINTPQHENCPMLSPDGRFLFFTRKGDVWWMDAGIIKEMERQARELEPGRHPLLVATFAEQESDLARIRIMMASLRTFGGRFKDAPFWVYLTEGLLASESEHLAEIESLGGSFRLGQAPEEAAWFYFSGKVFASAQAEAEASGKADFLAWLDSDTVFLGEPGEFILPRGKSLGYRPVMHRNISPLYDEPLDEFWKRAYGDMAIPESRVFPMAAVADGEKIRPYINAGCLIVRPERGLLRKWAETFPLLYGDPVLKEMCREDERKRIFIHQVALSGAVMKHLGREEILELSDRINYPIFFGEMFGSERDFHDIGEAVTIRYETFFDNPPQDWDKRLTGPPDRIAWLKAHLGDVP
jgi:ankyrin repeat protein